jgi:hypothetical protein
MTTSCVETTPQHDWNKTPSDSRLFDQKEKKGFILSGRKLVSSNVVKRPPSRVGLSSDMSCLDGRYASPIRQKSCAVTIQNHHQTLSRHYRESGEVPTPNTRLFWRSGQQLVDVGPDSVVKNREELLRQIAEVYRHGFPKQI